MSYPCINSGPVGVRSNLCRRVVRIGNGVSCTEHSGVIPAPTEGTHVLTQPTVAQYTGRESTAERDL